MNVLISDPDTDWAGKMKKFLAQNNISASLAFTGKDCQLQVYQNAFESVVLDLEVKHHSAFEVLRYLKLNYPNIKIVLSTPSHTTPESYGISSELLKKLGVNDILEKPYDEQKLLDCFSGKRELQAWKDMTASSKSSDGAQALEAGDEEFSQISIESFYGNDVTIMDYYIRIGAGKYFKILHRGDQFDRADLDKMIQEKKLTFLYFKNSDRALYINFMNSLFEEDAPQKVETQKIVPVFKEVVEKYVTELRDSGVHPELIDEGKSLCTNLFNTISEDRNLKQMLNDLAKADPGTLSQQFLSSFFAVAIANDLEWASRRTTEFTAMGALLHEIGKLKLPSKIVNVDPRDLAGEGWELYKKYPQHGFDILNDYAFIPEPVRQIVLQHRELSDGTGFPNAIAGNKIYPLAKVVAVSSAFAEMIRLEKLTPMDALRKFVTDRYKIVKYDPLCVKSLIKTFTTKKGTK